MKKLLSNIGIIAIVFFVIFLCLELLLRLTSYGALMSIVTFDESTGYRLLPNKKITYKTKTYSFDIKINSLGLRDQEFSKNEVVGQKPIIFLGDSQTFGHGLQMEESYPELVEKEFHCRTINAGCVGWGIDQSLLYLEHYGIDFSPRAVVLGISLGSDLQDMNGEFNEKFIASDYKALRMLVSQIRRGERKDSLGRVIKSYLRCHSQAFSFLADKARVVSKLLVLRFNRKNSTSREYLPDLLQLYYNKRPYFSKSVEANYRKLDEILLDFKSFCRANQIKFYVLLIPHKVQVSDMEWGTILKMYSLKTEDFDRSLPQKKIIEFCDLNGIAVIDGTLLFREHYKQSNELLYFNNDAHMNSSGHRILANQVTAFLLKQRD